MIIKSSKCVITNGKYKPVCSFDTDRLTVTIIDPETQFEKVYLFNSDYIKYHVHYVASKYKGYLNKYVDDCTIYAYLSDLETKAIAAENSQVERWMKSDQEYLAAIDCGDEQKANGLLNTMHYMAREIVMDCMIY